jgi:23S rRNA (cytidine1920-2'-O)/16S rRNA (cytidine1409-2'-O)-methyltransferase
MTRGESGATRERLDVLLVRRGLAPTRARAQALVLAGRVRSGTSRLEKPGQRVPTQLPLEVVAGPTWVGRGALKLEAALSRFAIAVQGRDVLDVGASTGGFTEVLLHAGARRVAALDVGRGQLDWSLRRDPRVHVLEGLNARHLRPDVLPFRPSLAVVDVSFISLRLVLPPVVDCLADPREVVALVKPQFEVGPRQVGRGGIVRDPGLHAAVLGGLTGFLRQHGWGVRGIGAAAVRGAAGNQEFFVTFAAGAPGWSEAAVEQSIREATRDERGGT